MEVRGLPTPSAAGFDVVGGGRGNFEPKVVQTPP